MVGPADKVAKVAAALFHAGDAATLRRAVEMASDRCGSGAIPSMATVQKHLEAVRQSTAGMGAWDAVRLQQLDVIAELLQTLTFIEPEAACYVTGRAAEGFVDDTAPAHLRLVGGRGPALVADDLETQGFPPCTVSSLTTQVGSVAIVHVQDDLLHADIMVLPDVPEAHKPLSLVGGRQVALLDEVGFSELIASLAGL